MCNDVSVTINENEAMVTDNEALNTNDILEKQSRLLSTVEGVAVLSDVYDKVESWLCDMRDDSRERHNRNLSHFRDMRKNTSDDISRVEREMYTHAIKMETVAFDGEYRVYRRVAHACSSMKENVSQDLKKLGRELTDTEKLYVEANALLMLRILLAIKDWSYSDFYDTSDLSEDDEKRGYWRKVKGLIYDDMSFDCFNHKLLNFHEAANARTIKKLTTQYAHDAIEAIYTKIIERADEIERLLSSNESNENA